MLFFYINTTWRYIVYDIEKDSLYNSVDKVLNNDYPIHPTFSSNDTILQKIPSGLLMYKGIGDQLVLVKKMLPVPTALSISGCIMENVRGLSEDNAELMKQGEALLSQQELQKVYYGSKNQIHGESNLNTEYMRIPMTSYMQDIRGINIEAKVRGRNEGSEDLEAWIEHGVLDRNNNELLRETVIIIDVEEECQWRNHFTVKEQILQQLQEGNTYMIWVRSGQTSQVFLQEARVTFYCIRVVNEGETHFVTSELERYEFGDSDSVVQLSMEMPKMPKMPQMPKMPKMPKIQGFGDSDSDQ